MKEKKMQKKGSRLASVFRTIGTILLLAIVLMCIPMTVPTFLGYQVYTVVSGSMEPTIPTGSLVYVKAESPENIAADDIIAFYSGSGDGGIITHRVVENCSDEGNFITKGDANEQEDVTPVGYERLIGKLTFHIPYLGTAAYHFSGTEGKTAAGGIIVFAVILYMVASLLDKRKMKKNETTRDEHGEEE